MKYFAYGIDLGLLQSNSESADYLGLAKAKEYVMVFKGEEWFAHPTIEYCQNEEIIGGLWEIDENDDTLVEWSNTLGYQMIDIDVIFNDEIYTVKTYAIIDKPYGIGSFEYVDTLIDLYENFDIDSDQMSNATSLTNMKMGIY